MDRDVCPAREGEDVIPAVANEAVGGARASATAIEAQSTFGNRHSRGLAVAATRRGMLWKETGMTALPRVCAAGGEDQIAGP